MGKRTRRKGIANSALRAARAAARERDEEAAAVAQEVYETCVVMRDVDDEQIPLVLRGPLMMLGFRAAPGIADRNGLPRSEEVVHDIIAYLTSGYLAMLVDFNVKHFEQWRNEADQAEGKVVLPPGVAG